MAFTDLIKPGDKIDIRLLQQVENEERTGDTVKVYKSQVLDINKRGNLEISMPTEETKLILLSWMYVWNLFFIPEHSYIKVSDRL